MDCFLSAVITSQVLQHIHHDSISLVHSVVPVLITCLNIGMIVDSLYCNINCRIVYFSTINWVVRSGASVFRANKPWCTTSMQRELDASFPKSETGCTESKHRNFQNTVAVRWYQVTQSAECLQCVSCYSTDDLQAAIRSSCEAFQSVMKWYWVNKAAQYKSAQHCQVGKDSVSSPDDVTVVQLKHKRGGVHRD